MIAPAGQANKVVSGGWFTSECFICGVAFYDLFVHSILKFSAIVFCTSLLCTALL